MSLSFWSNVSFCGVKGDKNYIGNLDGVGDLVLDWGFEGIVWVFETGGIDKSERIIDDSYNIVASSALFACDDGNISMGKTIKNARFASIRLSDECNNR